MADQYDVIVIGGGPGGYVAAIRAAQLGLKVACIEKRGALGGTCLNVGCIPSKAMLHDSELFDEISTHGKERGIVGSVKVDVAAMLKRKGDVVKGLTGGIEMLFKKNKIDYLKGQGIIMGKGVVALRPSADPKKSESLKTKHIIIATGSEAISLPGITIDEKNIVTSTGALELKKVPATMAIIGGGVIGLELGSVWRRLGAKVTVIEYLDRITPTMDGEVSKEFQKILEKQGISFQLGAKVTGAKATAKGVEFTVEPAKGGKAEKQTAEVLLVAVGRRPNTDGLGVKEAGVAFDERGRIQTDGHYRTNVEGIYAIGDVIAGPMLAHKAEEEGVAVAELIAGQKPHIDYNLIPSVVYTSPEVAAVGKTEEQLKTEGRAYKVGKFPFLANSRARTVGHTEGFVKILADATTDEVLGVHIIGIQAGTMISEATIAMEFKASAEDIARTCHSHPDLNEAIKEAALGVAKRTIHM